MDFVLIDYENPLFRQPLTWKEQLQQPSIINLGNKDSIVTKYYIARIEKKLALLVCFKHLPVF